jgi:hypothetical protein
MRLDTADQRILHLQQIVEATNRGGHMWGNPKREKLNKEKQKQ